MIIYVIIYAITTATIIATNYHLFCPYGYTAHLGTWTTCLRVTVIRTYFVLYRNLLMIPAKYSRTPLQFWYASLLHFPRLFNLTFKLFKGYLRHLSFSNRTTPLIRYQYLYFPRDPFWVKNNNLIYKPHLYNY